MNRSFLPTAAFIDPHGGIMAVQSMAYPHSIGHLWGDVLALFAVAAVLALPTPRGRAGAPPSVGGMTNLSGPVPQSRAFHQSLSG